MALALLRKTVRLICLFSFYGLVFAGTEKSQASTERTLESQDLPLLEMGLVGVTFFTPDYPAAEQGSLRTLAVPYAYYRGKQMRAEEGGMRGRLMDQQTWDVDLSLAGSFPADSRHNRAREGMPNIDWIGEVGPRLRIHLEDFASSSRYFKWNFLFPIHYVFSTNFRRWDDRGYLFKPEMEWKWRYEEFKQSDLILSLSATFASDQLMDYFYEVPDSYATPLRPAYQAQGGYLGMGFLVGATREYKSGFKFFCGVKGDFYQYSVNRSSPLFKQLTNWGFGMGFSSRLWESEERGYSDN